MGSKLYTRGERIFKWVSLVLLLVICVATLAPFVLILASSLTDETTLITYGYSFWPQKFSMESYLYMWNQRKQIGRSYLTSLGITAVGTVVSLLFTTMLAYPMSRKDFKYSNQLSFFVFFTMLFNGGIVSSYIMWTQIFHIKNTYFALLLPNLLMNAMNIMLVRNYYKNSIPFELVEAAEIDGASELKTFWKIMVPLSVPVNVTVGLFTGLAYWNDWINALYYVDDPVYYGIQNFFGAHDEQHPVPFQWQRCGDGGQRHGFPAQHRYPYGAGCCRCTAHCGHLPVPAKVPDQGRYYGRSQRLKETKS